MTWGKKVQVKLARFLHGSIERLFRVLEKPLMSRGAVFEEIPFPKDRSGGLGTTTYAEWCYTIGLFQTLIFEQLRERPVRMLDVGCGTGRLYLAVKPYLTEEDQYTGIDVNSDSIDRCKRLYSSKNIEFLHTEASNGFYAADTPFGMREWPLKNERFNLVTALSVWTHMREEDWRFYLNEVHRVLCDEGRAIISFFVLDEDYQPDLKQDRRSRYYPQNERKWIFDKPAYGSENWFTPSWASVPEIAIAVDKATFIKTVAETGFEIVEYKSGQWKDHPGFFFQDVVILEKRGD